MSSPNPYSHLPFHPSVPTSPYEINIPSAEIEKFNSLISLSYLPSDPSSPNTPTIPLTNPLLSNGSLSPSYLTQARTDLLHSLPHAWQTHEENFNSYPNFLSRIEHEDHTYDIHFLALFSTQRQENLETVVFLHGYPSSPFAFTPILDLLRERYTPETLPFNVVVPSLPGFGFSSSPPGESFSIQKAGEVLDSLLRGLGIKEYIVSANDLGSFVAREMYAKEGGGCTALHLSMVVPPARLLNPETLQNMGEGRDEDEKICLSRRTAFMTDGGSTSINVLQGLRPGLVGLVAGSHPLGILGWVGRRLWEWSDTSLLSSSSSSSPPENSATARDDNDRQSLFTKIHAKTLQTTHLYFLTQTLQRCLWFSREVLTPSPPPLPATTTSKRGVAYTLFTHDIIPTPEQWALEALGIEGFRVFRRHERGGHFACWEVPEVLLGDVEVFIEGLRSGVS